MSSSGAFHYMKPPAWPEHEASPGQSDIHRQRTPPPIAFAKFPGQAGEQLERGVEVFSLSKGTTWDGDAAMAMEGGWLQ